MHYMPSAILCQLHIEYTKIGKKKHGSTDIQHRFFQNCGGILVNLELDSETTSATQQTSGWHKHQCQVIVFSGAHRIEGCNSSGN